MRSVTLILSLCIIIGCASGSKPAWAKTRPLPRFSFYNEMLQRGKYKERETAREKLLASYHVDLGPKQRAELCLGMRIPKRFKTYDAFMILTGKKKPYRIGKRGELRGYYLLDLNRDGTIDLILVANGYFGPTPGFIFMARQGNGFRYLYDNSGAVLSIERHGDLSIIRYGFFIIDTAECNVLVNIMINHRQRSASIGSRQYIAQQTRNPGSLSGYRYKQMARPFLLRHSSPFLKPVQMQQGTRVLEKDILARCKPQRIVVLLRKRGWLFVAVPVVPGRVESGMHHGMDVGRFDYTSKRTVFFKKEQHLHLCGWVKE